MNIFAEVKKKRDKNSQVIIESKSNRRIDREEFFKIIEPILSNETVQQMKNYKQHCNTSCYSHCLHVAFYSYVICKKLGLDYVSVSRAAMLHDLFLYDWRTGYRDKEFYGMHAFTHPKIALRNSQELFALNSKEQDIILKHMWPVTFSLPKYKESYIVTFIDKFSAIKESFLFLCSQLKRKRVYKYAYVFLNLILFRIV